MLVGGPWCMAFSLFLSLSHNGYIVLRSTATKAAVTTTKAAAPEPVAPAPRHAHPLYITAKALNPAATAAKTTGARTPTPANPPNPTAAAANTAGTHTSTPAGPPNPTAAIAIAAGTGTSTPDSDDTAKPKLAVRKVKLKVIPPKRSNADEDVQMSVDGPEGSKASTFYSIFFSFILLLTVIKGK